MSTFHHRYQTVATPLTSPTRQQMQLLDELVAGVATATAITAAKPTPLVLDGGEGDESADAFDAYDGALDIESRQF